MLSSLNTGVIGLGVEQNAMNVISNNISNVNTVGYKSQRVEFQSLLAQTVKDGSAPTSNGIGGTNPEQVGIGVTTGAVTTDQSEGALNYTGKNTDLALSGDGYFVVSDGQKNYFTRDGSFDFDSNGNFLQPSDGMKVMGWSAINNVISAEGAPKPINIPRGMTLSPQATGNITLKGNLDSTTTDIPLAGVIQGSSTAGTPSPASPVNVAVRIMNSKNELISGTLSLTQEGSTQTWDANFTPDAGSATKLATGATATSLGKITFDNTGAVSDNTLSPLSLSYAASDGALPQTITIDPSNLQIRTDVTSSQIGFKAPLASDPPSATVPGTDVGVVYAGGYTMTINFFDATGTSHAGTLVFQRDLDAQVASSGTTNPVTTWRAQLIYNDPAIKDDTSGTGAGAGPIPIDMGSLSFDQNGLLSALNLNSATIKYTNGSATSTIAFNPGNKGDINGLTQLNSQSTALVNGQDGYGLGSLTSVAVDPTGVITGTFNNGQTRNLAQVAVATFANPDGLLAKGQNLLTPSQNSGVALIGTAGTFGRGTIDAGNLEQSNVDLAKQFADLIITQRSFDADSKIVSTSDQILQELLQLKQ